MNGDKLRSEVIDMIQNLQHDQVVEVLKFVKQLQLRQRLEKAEKEFDEGKAVN